jgi:hypothetical protein
MSQRAEAESLDLREIIYFCTERKWESLIRYSFFVHKRIILAVKKAELLSDRMSYIILRGRWSHINVLNVHAPRENKISNVKKKSFYQELRCAFDNFLRSKFKILLRDFTIIIGKENIFRWTIGNEISHECTMGYSNKLCIFQSTAENIIFLHH